METFNKLAGVQDAYHDDSAGPAVPLSSPRLGPDTFSSADNTKNLHDSTGTPIPTHTSAVASSAASIRSTRSAHRAGRASVPLNRKASHKSIRSQKGGNSGTRSRATSRGAASITAVAAAADAPPTPTISKFALENAGTNRSLPSTPKFFSGMTLPGGGNGEGRDYHDSENKEYMLQQTTSREYTPRPSTTVSSSMATEKPMPRLPRKAVPSTQQQQPSQQAQGSRRTGPGGSEVDSDDDEEDGEMGASRGATQNNIHQDDDRHSEADDDDDAEFPWGPSHPCFPHPNPHCAPTSPEFQSTRVIRVRRDWLSSSDLYPQYANLYPEILDPLVSDAEFRAIIAGINDILKQYFATNTWAAWVDASVGVVTGFLWEDLGWTNVRRGEKLLEGLLERWNRERMEEGREVRIVQLRRTGFMNLDFVIPDPGIDAVDEEEEDGEGRR